LKRERGKKKSQDKPKAARENDKLIEDGERGGDEKGRGPWGSLYQEKSKQKMGERMALIWGWGIVFEGVLEE